MGIVPSVTIRPISEDDFHSIDHKIMALVFGIHKDLGRLCDEKIYQNELAHRDTNLFYDAITHFRGGFEHVIKKIPVIIDSRVLGTQHMHLLNPEVGFKISSAKKAISFYERHLQSFLSHTPLRAIQWINLNHDKILFKSLLR